MITSSKRISLLLRVVWVSLIGALPALAQQTVSGTVAPGDWAGVRAAYEAGRHAAEPTAGGYQAHNPGQGWFMEFDGRGFLVRPSTDDWSWGLELLSYGRAGNEHAVSDSATVSAEGGRVVNRWDDVLEEWYINDTRGLEHGFTILERPQSSPNTEDELLSLTLRVRGELTPIVSESGRGVSFLNQTGARVLNYAGLTVFDSGGKEMPAWFEATGYRLRILLDDREAQYPLTIDPIAQRAYLKASNAQGGDSFGDSVSISGDTMVVGAIKEDGGSTGVNGDESDNSALHSGAAYVFVRNGSTWNQEAYLKASNTETTDQFGVSVAISGDTIIVGAFSENSDATGINGDQVNNNAPDSGAAYVFVRSGTTWSQQAYLKASNTDTADWFGSTVAISGNTVVVGARREDSEAKGVNKNQASNHVLEAGAAYVFVRNGTTWSQEAYLKASNTGVFDEFSRGLAISGETVVIGSSNEDSNATGINGDQTDNSAISAGAVYVFVRNGTTWSQEAYLKGSNTEGGDNFGLSVEISGNTLISGAWTEDSASSGVNGDETNNGALLSGAAYVFVRNGTTWTQEAYLKPSTTDASQFIGDGFGSSVAVDGDTVVVNAFREDSDADGVNGDETDNSAKDAGAAYVFTRMGTTWSQVGYLKAFNSDFNDNFGLGLALSASTLVVTANGEDSQATGIDGDEASNAAQQSGAAYVFDTEALALNSDVTNISLSSGGQQVMTLSGEASRAGWIYFLLGSASGTSPGIDFGGGILLPLSFDAYLSFILAHPFFPAFGNYFSLLNGIGEGTSILTIPAGSDPTLAGITLNHAYLAAEVVGFSEFASNAISVQLVP